MKDLLYKAIKDFCDENHCWLTKNTAREWNRLLNTNYSGATFTALVNAGLLDRGKYYEEKSYRYFLPQSPEVIAKRKQSQKQVEIDLAEYYVENYEKRLAKIEADYQRAIAIAEENRKKCLDDENERYRKGKELLENIESEKKENE